MKIGLKGHKEETVTEELTAMASGSGPARVYATPKMIALMERTCWQTAREQLPEGRDTVGTMVNIRHLAATPVGMEVRCDCELIHIDRRALTFSVKVCDEAGIIGEGIHERFVIDREKFQAKTDAKRVTRSPEVPGP